MTDGQEHMGFRALADPTRRNILKMLAAGDLTIAEVAENFQMTRAAVNKHLTILAEGDLITVQTRGRARVNAINAAGLRRVFDWFDYFDAFWDQKLATLKSEIEKDVQ